MQQNLSVALMTSIEALMQVPGTQLQHIESTLRQLLTDLKEANVTPPAELNDLIEEAAIAHAETLAILKDTECPKWMLEPEEEPDWDEIENRDCYPPDEYFEALDYGYELYKELIALSDSDLIQRGIDTYYSEYFGEKSIPDWEKEATYKAFVEAFKYKNLDMKACLGL